MKIGIIGAGMMGSSLFHACENKHDPVLIAKESMHLVQFRAFQTVRSALMICRPTILSEKQYTQCTVSCAHLSCAFPFVVHLSCAFFWKLGRNLSVH